MRIFLFIYILFLLGPQVIKAEMLFGRPLQSELMRYGMNSDISKSIYLKEKPNLPSCDIKRKIWNNCHGYAIYRGGDSYYGEWKDNLRHGRGVVATINADIYEGKWKNDTFNGFGTYFFGAGSNQGDLYIGEWEDGKWHGQGKYSHADGREYTGEFKDGKRHGKGFYREANMDKYPVIYDNDIIVRFEH